MEEMLDYSNQCSHFNASEMLDERNAEIIMELRLLFP